MTERRRIYTFPGGVLEIDDYGDSDTGGVYLDWRTEEEFEHASEPLARPQCPVQFKEA